MKAIPLAQARQSNDHLLNPLAGGMERSRRSLKALGIKFVVGAILVGFVVLLTALFSFVGTITCCVLFGMMLGGFRGSKGSAFAVSMVFPVVAIVLLQFPTAAVPWQKAFTLATLCFATFWVMYFLTRCLTLPEAKARSMTAPIAGSSRPTAQCTDRRAGEIHLLSSAPVLASSLEQLELAELQGEWIAREVGNGTDLSAAMEFNREKVSFQRRDADGNLKLCWEGSVKCESLGPFRIIKVSNVRTLSGKDQATDMGQAWIYHLNAQTLTIASKFEPACGGKPSLQRYRKVEVSVPSEHPHSASNANT